MSKDCDCNCGSSTSGVISGSTTCSKPLRGRIYAPTCITAYEIAVNHGFEGTEEEWLESLKGDPGHSAYEIAVEHGFVGTEEEWLESLKGEPGKSAYEIAVEHGYSGTEEEWIAEITGNFEKVEVLQVQVENLQDQVGDLQITLDKYGSKLDPILEAEDESQAAGDPIIYKLVVEEKEEDDEKDFVVYNKMTASEINDICRL